MSDRDIQLIFRELRSQGKTPVDLLVDIWAALDDDERKLVEDRADPPLRIGWPSLFLQSGSFTPTVRHTPRSPRDLGERWGSPPNEEGLGPCEWKECENTATIKRTTEWGDMYVCIIHPLVDLDPREEEATGLDRWRQDNSYMGDL